MSWVHKQLRKFLHFHEKFTAHFYGVPLFIVLMNFSPLSLHQLSNRYLETFLFDAHCVAAAEEEPRRKYSSLMAHAMNFLSSSRRNVSNLGWILVFIMAQHKRLGMSWRRQCQPHKSPKSSRGHLNSFPLKLSYADDASMSASSHVN